MRLLRIEDLEALHELALDRTGGRPGFISRDNLELIVARVDAWVYGQPRFADVFAKAASYAEGLATLHPFTDGNKRTGYLAAVQFLASAGYFVRDAADAEQTMVDLAERRISLNDFADWLRSNSS